MRRTQLLLYVCSIVVQVSCADADVFNATLPAALRRARQQLNRGALAATLSCWANGTWLQTVRARRDDVIAGDDPFQWQPHGPCLLRYKQWDRAAFCAAIRRRSILIVGDSLNKQLHDALVAATASTSSERACAADSVRERCRGHMLCDQGTEFRLAFTRNDRLLSSTWKPAYSDKFILHPWNGDLAKWRYNIVILNKGTHFLKTSMFIREYRDTLNYIRRKYPRALIIVRTTPAGHPHCLRSTEPLPSLPDWAVHPSAADSSWMPFHWGEMAEQNAALRALISREYPRGSVLLMDVEAATSMRPDRHRGRTVNRKGVAKVDCLHYKFPGSSVLEDWVVRLFNIIEGVNALR